MKSKSVQNSCRKLLAHSCHGNQNHPLTYAKLLRCVGPDITFDTLYLPFELTSEQRLQAVYKWYNLTHTKTENCRYNKKRFPFFNKKHQETEKESLVLTCLLLIFHITASSYDTNSIMTRMQQHVTMSWRLHLADTV